MTPDAWLRAAAAVLCAGAVAVIFADASSSPGDAEETGRLVGAAFRNVVLGLALGVLATYVFSSAMHEGVGWRDLTTDGYVVGGVIALALSLAIGAPVTEGEQFADGAEECLSSQPDPGSALGYRKLGPDEIVRLGGRAPPPELAGTTLVYLAGTRRTGELVTVSAIGDSDSAHRDTQAGFSDAQTSQGATAEPLSLAGEDAIKFTVAGSPGTTVFARKGCYIIAVSGLTSRGSQDRMTEILSDETGAGA